MYLLCFQILWSQQQYELKRFKRDFVPTGNVTKHISKKPILRFPDPLFADQWYLVSFVSNNINNLYLFCFLEHFVIVFYAESLKI